MSKYAKKKSLGSIFIIFIGIILIAYGLIYISLGIVGDKDTAVITSIRRQGGERNETIPNRYTYSIGYYFNLPDGKTVYGSTYRIGNSVYIKAHESNSSMVPVRYLRALPFINALESETGLKTGNFIIIAVGIIIIKLIKPKGKSKKL